MTRHPLRRLMFLVLAAILASAFSAPVSAGAQDGDVAVSEASPGANVEAQQEPVATGMLQLIALSCETAEPTGYTALLLEGELASDAVCYDGLAAVVIDDVDYWEVNPALELSLDAGPHVVADVTTGATRAIDVLPDVLQTVWVVAFTPASVEETPAEAAEVTSTLSLIVHTCEPAILSADELLALGGRYERLAACPVLTLPGEDAPGGSVTAGQEWFDVAVESGEGFSASMAEAVFAPDASCESEIGIALTTDPYDDACFSTSRYDVAVPASVLSVVPTALPPLARFGYAETDDPANSGAVTVVDPSVGSLTVDMASGYDDPLAVHLYLLSPPELTIVQHLCGEEVASAGDLEALGGFVERSLACPATARAIDGGLVDTTVDLVDGAGVPWALSEAALVTSTACEIDMGIEIDGVADNNACLEMPAYRWTNVARGYVQLWQAFGSGDLTLGGVDFVPGTGDGATLASLDPPNGTVAVDTSFDGDVVVHLYALQAPAAEPEETPDPTPAPTETPGAQTGSVQIAALYCLGAQSVTHVTALPPGQQATAAELSGDCLAGDAQIQLTLAGGEVQPATRIGREGLLRIDELPVTDGDVHHLLTHSASNQSASFDIRPGVLTRVILRIEVAMSDAPDPGPSSTGSTGASATQPPPQQPGANPLDLLGSLVTDELITDELGGAIPDAGMSPAGSFDSNSFVVDLLGGLETDELMAVTADGIPVVGRSPGGNDREWPVAWLVVMASLAAVATGWMVRRRLTPG